MRVVLDWPNPSVARITIDNQAHKNALTLAMWRDLKTACHTAEHDQARVVILRGAGELSFSTGADISEFLSHRSTPEGVEDYDIAISEGMAAVCALPMPVIAQISGLCVGGGVALAAMADLRYATPDTRFGIPAGKLGIAYQRTWIDRIVMVSAPSAVTEMLLTAQMFPAETALRWGLVNALIAPEDMASSVSARAEGMARLAPLSLRAAKAALSARQGGIASDHADQLIAACDKSHDYSLGIAAFMAGERPAFQGN